MILVRLLIATCILIVGIIIGKFLKHLVKKTERENKEMEAILKKYGRHNKPGSTEEPGDGGRGDIPHRL